MVVGFQAISGVWQNVIGDDRCWWWAWLRTCKFHTTGTNVPGTGVIQQGSMTNDCFRWSNSAIWIQRRRRCCVPRRWWFRAKSATLLFLVVVEKFSGNLIGQTNRGMNTIGSPYGPITMYENVVVCSFLHDLQCLNLHLMHWFHAALIVG